MNDPEAPRALGLTLWRQTWPMAIACLVQMLWAVQSPVFTRLGADAGTRELIRIYCAPRLLAALLGAVLYFDSAHRDTWLPDKPLTSVR